MNQMASATQPRNRFIQPNSNDHDLAPARQALVRCESEDFMQSGFGDFQDDDLPSPSLETAMQHFDWGKAKMVRMMSEATMSTNETEEDHILFPCHETQESGGSSKHSSSTAGSHDSKRSSSKKKKNSKTSGRSTTTTSKRHEDKASLKASGTIKTSGSLSQLKGRRRKSMGGIPENKVVHEARTSCPSKSGIDYAYFHGNIPPPPLDLKSQESRDFDTLVKNRKGDAFPTFALERMLPFKNSGSLKHEEPISLEECDRYVKSQFHSRIEFPAIQPQAPQNNLIDVLKDIVFVPRPDDFIRFPRSSSLPGQHTSFLSDTNEKLWEGSDSKDVVVHMDRLLQGR